MSLLGLLDTEVNIYRAVDLGDKFGDATGTPELVAADVGATFNSPRLSDSDSGPGGRVSGYMIMHMSPETDVQEGDILKYVNGTRLPTNVWKCGPVYRPRNKVAECWVYPWNGKIP